jgi:hypothetical protein
MTFFIQAIQDGTIDEKTTMSEREMENAIIARVLESNAWERHQKIHKDAKVSSISEEGGFSEIEKKAGRREENRPAITYDSHTKNFVIGCNCGKEKFVFDMKNDSVQSIGPSLKMKEVTAYNQNTTRDNNSNTYGGTRNSTANIYGFTPTGYSSGPQTIPNSPYHNNGSQPSVNYNSNKFDFR